jgi:hypothetical protein
MVFLFTNELSTFVQIKTSSEMLVDLSNSSETLKINLDLTLKRIPCSIISLDVQDIMGTHSINIQGTLLKKRLNKEGKVIGALIEKKNPDTLRGHDFVMPEYSDVKQSVLDAEGCQLYGNFEVLKVPGNFHISSHAYGTIIGQLIAEGIFEFDVSHRINHISFGDESHIKHIMTNFNAGILNPIDGVEKFQKMNENKIYEYYLKVVPTTYVDLQGNKYNVHQFTSNHNENEADIMIPTLYFRYDISPILVKIVQYKEEPFHFFVQICAIIGGVFTVTGILDTMLNRLTTRSKTD